jgi:hypothetical protein
VNDATTSYSESGNSAATNPTRPKRIVKRTSKDYSTPSIKDALNGKFKNEEEHLSAKAQFELHTKSDELEVFTKEDMEAKWKMFLTRLDEFPNLKSTLAKVPELRDNFQLYLEVDNSFQLEAINLKKPELMSFLRSELKNSKVELLIEVSAKIKKPGIYTETDRFEAMVKKNPSLKKLKQKFNLDFGQV